LEDICSPYVIGISSPLDILALLNFGLLDPPDVLLSADSLLDVVSVCKGLLTTTTSALLLSQSLSSLHVEKIPLELFLKADFLGYAEV
jgi:hypothetical protein